MYDDDSMEDMLLAGLVISTRFWRMASGHPGSSREAERMVSEKMTAAAQGYLDLTFGLMTGNQKCWTNPMGTFCAPGRKTLRRNATRLAGYRGAKA